MASKKCEITTTGDSALDSVMFLDKTSIPPAVIKQVAKDLIESKRASKSFGRSNSQVSAKLLTLTMIDSSPYRSLRQCLAQIESRTKALHEAQERIRAECDDSHRYMEDLKYIEGAIKEIATFQDAYKQILKNKDIPKDWDEKDFEEDEIKHHITTAFRLGFRDLVSSGRFSSGTIEYFEQLGIFPLSALKLTRQFIEESENNLKDDHRISDIKGWYSFLDHMFILFKDEYKKALDRIGLDTLVNSDFIFKDRNKED